jgi:hypothetical protein
VTGTGSRASRQRPVLLHLVDGQPDWRRPPRVDVRRVLQIRADEVVPPHLSHN